MSKFLLSACRELGLTIRGNESAWAVYSPCEKYRYALGRSWQEPLLPRQPVALWIAHNPSTATEEQDDPTIRREIAFSKREGCGGLVKCNVMAWRATDKKDIDPIDPIGFANSTVIRLCMAEGGPVVAAWGKLHKKHAHAAEMIPRLERIRCLGKNQDGSPVHPLYQPADALLIPWT